MAGTFRGKLLWLHTWSGILAGLAMLLFAITGGLLVMRGSLEDVLDARLIRGKICANAQPLDALLDRAREAQPRSEPKSVDITPGEGRSVAVEFRNYDMVYVDPCDASILGIQNKYGGYFGTLDSLHRFHFVEGGRVIGGICNVAILLFLVVGGLILWWPRSRAALKKGLKYDPHLPGTARLLSLHRVIGVYSAVLLLLMTLTAVPISFPWAKELIALATGTTVSSPPMPRNLSDGGPRLSMEEAWQRARAEMPDAQWMSINLPGEADAPLRVEILEPGAPHLNAKSYLFLDSVTGETLQRLRYAVDTPLGRKVYLYAIALHAGMVGGLPYQIALMLACFAVPVQVYSGLIPYLRKRGRGNHRHDLRLRIVARRTEAEGIISLELADSRGRPLPAFSAGSHIDLRVGLRLVRQYSLCNSPSETHRYIVAVQRAPDSRGGSRLVHEEFVVGRIVEASTPRNHFQLAHAASRSLLIAGGIGITPILCMAERLASAGAPFALHYCVRARCNAAFLDRMAGSPFSERVTLHVSEEGSRLEVAALLAQHDPETHIYVCGPNSLNEAVIAQALVKGWDEKHVHREYFTAAGHDNASNRPFDITIASTGAVLHVPPDRSVVEVLAGQGIEIPTSCSEGVCGTCLTRVLEGEVEHRDVLLSDEERERHEQFTPCCSRARSPVLVLDL